MKSNLLMKKMNSLLSIKNLYISYDGKQVVKNVNIDVGENEIVAIVGESGSGKTTVIKSIMDILPESGKITDGQIIFAGDDLTSMDRKDFHAMRGSHIGMIFQNPSGYLNPVLKVSTQFIESIQSHSCMSRAEALKIAKEALLKVQLPDVDKILASYVFELSGGMQQRVYIAMVMANRPKLLLADEPTSALDVCSRKTIADEILMLKDKENASFLIVTHDIALAAYLADRIVVMKDGRVVETNTKDEIIKNPKHEYTVELLDTVFGMGD